MPTIEERVAALESRYGVILDQQRIRELERRMESADDIAMFNASGGLVGVVKALQADSNVTFTKSGRFGKIASTGGGGGGSITVEEEDGAPSVGSVTKIQVPNGGLINDGAGVVSLLFELAGLNAAHLADAADAHDASAISILDTAGDFTATDVEGALAELQADAEAHLAAADPHTGYVLETILDPSGGAQQANTTPSSFTTWASQAGNARKIVLWDETQGKMIVDYLTAIDVLTPAQVLTFTATPTGAHPGGQSGLGLVDLTPATTEVINFSMTYQGTCTAATIDILSHTYGGGRSPEVSAGDYPATVLTPFTSLAGPAINAGQAVAESVTFRITATIDGQTKTKDVTVTYYNERLWGVSSNAAIDTDGEIDTFHTAQNKEISSARAKTFTVTAAAGEYIYYILRNALGTPTFTVGGFEGGFSKVGSLVSYSNDRAFAENYDVWRSDTSGLGSTTVVVT